MDPPEKGPPARRDGEPDDGILPGHATTNPAERACTQSGFAIGSTRRMGDPLRRRAGLHSFLRAT
jgi:hypothetical protein